MPCDLELHCPAFPPRWAHPGWARTVLLPQGAGSSHTLFWGAPSPFPPAPCVSVLTVCFPSPACLYGQGWQAGGAPGAGAQARASPTQRRGFRDATETIAGRGNKDGRSGDPRTWRALPQVLRSA